MKILERGGHLQRAGRGEGRWAFELTAGVAGAPPKGARDRTPAEGTGLGLANVCQRLSARFGETADCHFGPTGDGGYRVLMHLPANRDG